MDIDSGATLAFVPHHLESVPSGPADDPLEAFEREFLEPDVDEDQERRPLSRPAWWRWVAIAVILALIVAGPFAYVLSKLLS